MAIKKFTKYVSEAVENVKLQTIGDIVKQKLSKSMDVAVSSITMHPGYEIVDIDGKILSGIKFFVDRNCVRINWKREDFEDLQGNVETLFTNTKSITFFDRDSSRPLFNAEFKSETSLDDVTDSIAQVLQSSDKKEIDLDKDQDEIKKSEEVKSKAMAESYLSEAEDEYLTDLKRFLARRYKEKESFLKSRIVHFVGEPALKYFDKMLAKHPEYFKIRDNNYKVISEIPDSAWSDSESDSENTDVDTKSVDKENLPSLSVAREIPNVKIKKISNETIVDSTDISEVRGLYDLKGNRIPYKVQLENLAKRTVRLVQGHYNGLFVYGRGGTGKTTVIQQTLISLGKVPFDTDHPEKKADFEVVKIGASAPELFKKCYFYREKGQVVVLDDADSAFADKRGRNLIKALTESVAVRTISWPYDNNDLFNPSEIPAMARDRRMPEELLLKKLLEDGKYPKYYKFEGCMACISNVETLSELDPDGALRTRGAKIPISPMTVEFKEHLISIVDKLDFVGKNKLSKEEKIDTIVTFVDTVERLHEEGKINREEMLDKIQIRSIMRAMSERSEDPANWLENAFLHL
jgi:hypothetical protein